MKTQQLRFDPLSLRGCADDGGCRRKPADTRACKECRKDYCSACSSSACRIERIRLIIVRHLSPHCHHTCGSESQFVRNHTPRRGLTGNTIYVLVRNSSMQYQTRTATSCWCRRAAAAPWQPAWIKQWVIYFLLSEGIEGYFLCCYLVTILSPVVISVNCAGAIHMHRNRSELPGGLIVSRLWGVSVIRNVVCESLPSTV